MNDVVVTEDFIRERVSLDLSKIDDINSLKFKILKTPRSFKLFKPEAPKFFKLLKLIFKLFKQLIKPIDSLNPDEIN